MRISVVIPVYNAAPYLKACLASVAAAAGRLRAADAAARVEVLCVDDGSTDGSGALLDRYAAGVRPSASGFDFRVLHQPNAGVSAARNAGMDAATGECLAFLDADDTYDARALEVIADVRRKTEAEVIRYGCNLVRSHARDVPLEGYPEFAEVDLETAPESPLRRCSLGWASAVSARLARSVRWPDLTHCEDPLFILRCMKASRKNVFVEGNLANYLVRPGSAARTVSLPIVASTCRYLAVAYDECASMPGFAKSRADTCAFLARFLNGPLAGCGRDVPPEDREAAEAAVAEVRARLVARDGLFAILTRREHFDLVFSLGAACSGTEVLREAGLQFASFPFDWLLGPGPLARVETLAGEFAGWLDDPGEIEEVPNPDAFRHLPCRNRRTGYAYFHDFEQGATPASQLPAVRGKYARRAKRLLELIRGAKRVLVVWTGDPRDGERLSDAELTACLDGLRAKFPGVSFALHVFECVKGIPASDPAVSSAGELVRIAFDYRVPDAGNEWAVRREALLPYLAGYSVTDYRTPELRRARARAERMRDRERFSARTFAGYLLAKLEFKLYRHLGKALARRGVRME